jgi:ABC-2 type transport system ATP-binding protein
VAFGNTLHVSGDDAAVLERSVAPFHKPPYQWSKSEAGLEEAFIHLMERAEDHVAS